MIPSYWPAFQFGGPIYSVHNLNKSLAKKGIDVTVYTTNVGLDGKVSVNKEVDVDGVRVFYFEYVRLFEFLGATGWQFSWQMNRALKNNIRTFDIGYIVAIWSYPVAATAHYCRQYRKPYIISPRGVLYPYTIGKKSWKKLPYYYLVGKRDLEGAAAIHYTTEDEKEQCHGFLGLRKQAFVIPNAVDLSEFRELPSKGEFLTAYPHLCGKRLLLYLGRINWKKGLDILIGAFSVLVENFEDIHLVVVGEDAGDGYREEMEALVKSCGVEKSVTFTGVLSGGKKLSGYREAEIYILPSYSENFGMAVVEAMACGLPVVISNKVGIYREVEKHNAGIIVEANSESLYKGIKVLLDNDSLRNEIGANGKQLVERYYNIDKVADKMIEAYENILIRGASR